MSPLVRSHIATCLVNRVTEARQTSLHQTFIQSSAFQLALCHALGFGVVKDDLECRMLLDQFDLQQQNIAKEISAIKEINKGTSATNTFKAVFFRDGLYARERNRGHLSEEQHFHQQYPKQDQLDEIIRGYQRELADLENVLGNPHILINLLRFSLSYVLSIHDKWKEGEEEARKLVETCFKSLGKENADSLMASQLLASTYQQQGRWTEAQALQTEELEIRQRILGSRHPGTIDNMQHLAGTLAELGRWAEAEELQTVAMNANVDTFGPEHPATLTSTTQLALTLIRQGKWQRAAEFEADNPDKKIKILGRHHPQTLDSMSNLAIASQLPPQEEQLQLRTIVKTCQEVLGENHYGTMTCTSNLASVLLKQGKLKEAEQGKLKEAEQLQKHIVNISEETWGREHPDTLANLANLHIPWQNTLDGKKLKSY
ncbi:MAG: hypothetical protein LQ342_001432 [Letrouitia transgressa]|nr:MAG: hypothetical protein LQ342_001432 [Letrouitia transgressa]